MASSTCPTCKASKRLDHARHEGALRSAERDAARPARSSSRGHRALRTDQIGGTCSRSPDDGYLFLSLLAIAGTGARRARSVDGRQRHDHPYQAPTDRCQRTIRSSRGSDAKNEIWSYGHRNPQGLALDRVTGHALVNEQGRAAAISSNRSSAAHNYGWPLATYGRGHEDADRRQQRDAWHRVSRSTTGCRCRSRRPGLRSTTTQASGTTHLDQARLAGRWSMKLTVVGELRREPRSIF